MKKHILVEHSTAWRKWKNANVVFDLEELHREKFNKRSGIGYGAITENFKSANSYKRMMHNNKKLWKTCLSLKFTCLFLLLKVSG